MDSSLADARTQPSPYPSFIVETVGDVSNPSAKLPFETRLDHLPGDSSWLRGLRLLFGWTRHGNAYLREHILPLGKVTRWRIGPIHQVVVVDPDALLRILRNEDGDFSAALGWRDYFDGIDRHSKTMYGPLFVDFETHRAVRKLLQPAFASGAVASYVEDAAPIFASTLDAWVERGAIDFKPAVRRLLARVAGKIFLGIDDPAEAARLDADLAELWGAPFAIFHNVWLDPKWRAATKAYERLTRRLESMLAERRRTGRGRDLLSRMSTYEGYGASEFDDAARARTILGVLVGAFDTTAHGLASMAYLLARHPEWQERLRDEALALGPRPTTFEDTRRLEWTERAFRESLRLFPVAPSVPRRALRDTSILGHRIPAGTFFVANISGVLQDPSIWTDPLAFDPERFAPPRSEDRRHPAAFLAFGGGAHSCLGMQLSIAEAKAFTHALLVRCRFRLAEDYVARHECSPLGTVSGPVRVVFERL